MMRKTLIILAVLMFASQVLADVTITSVQDSTNKAKVWIHYNASGETDLIRAFALQLTVDNGKKITGISGYKPDGESTQASPGYGIYVGSIQIDGSGNVTDYNNPVAPSDAPDNPPQLGSSSIIIELGSLYVGETNAPTNDANLCAVTIDLDEEAGDDCNLCIAEDALRGGIVMEDTNAPEGTVTLGCTYIVVEPAEEPECFDSGHADYSTWVGVGKPSCWCYKYQCLGDTDGKKYGDTKNGYYYVESQDLSKVFASMLAEDSSTRLNICADIDRKKLGDTKNGYYRVESQDLSRVFGHMLYEKSELDTDSKLPCGGTILLN